MKMRKKLITALVLGACLGTQAFAQNTKQDTITFSLTVQEQASVSTSTAPNAGNWSQGPLYYKTQTLKLTQTDILKAIAYVLHHNGTFYSPKASLILVQGELGGFWNIYDSLAQSYEDFTQYFDASTFLPSPPFNLYAHELTGSFNFNGWDGNFYDYGTGWVQEDPNGNIYFGPSTWSSTLAADNPIYYPGVPFSPLYALNGNNDYAGPYWETQNANPSGSYNEFATYLDNGMRTSISDGNDEYARLATGRHFLPVPWVDYTTLESGTFPSLLATTGEYPPGHMQPWGQIYVRDPGAAGFSATDPLCENVTFFFYLAVQECYDCFYLNSFISDASFKAVSGAQSGPPCCTSPSFLVGKGTDHYYLSLSFDNTVNNGYLNPTLYTNRDDSSCSYGQTSYYYEYTGYPGIQTFNGVADGVTPDLLVYSDLISKRVGPSSPYEMRFTLNGLVTYSWTLEKVNTSDTAADFVGTASYSANGYGFIKLYCALLTGSATFTEKIVKDIGCCDDMPWNQVVDISYDPIGFNVLDNFTHSTGWYGPGTDDKTGYYNPKYDPKKYELTDYNFYPTDPYPFYNVIAGWSYDNTSSTLNFDVFNVVPTYSWDMPDQNESPFNPDAALTQHGVINEAAGKRFKDGTDCVP